MPLILPTHIGRITHNGRGIPAATDAICAKGTGAVWVDEEGDVFMADAVPDSHARYLVGIYSKKPSPTRIAQDLGERASELQKTNRATRYA